MESRKQHSGTTWKTPGYSTGALSQGTSAWDWFSLQFNDGKVLMLCRLGQWDGDLGDRHPKVRRFDRKRNGCGQGRRETDKQHGSSGFDFGSFTPGEK